MSKIKPCCKKTDSDYCPDCGRSLARGRSIAEAFANGLTRQEVADQFAISYVRVCQFVNDWGVRPKRAGHHQSKLCTHHIVKIIGRLVNTERSMADIGKEFGVTREYVRQLATMAESSDIPIRSSLSKVLEDE